MASGARCMFSQIVTFPTYNRLEHSPELFICQLQPCHKTHREMQGG